MWLCEISHQRHVREQAGHQNASLSENLENVDKRAVKQVHKLLQVGRFCAAKTVGRSKRLQKVSGAIYARAQMHGEISTAGPMLLQKSTNRGCKSHKYQKTSPSRVCELQFTTKQVCWLHTYQLALKLW